MLGRKAFAAFGAASGENPASANGGYACAEAVAAFANEFARLIGSFHDCASKKRFLTRASLIASDGGAVNKGYKSIFS